MRQGISHILFAGVAFTDLARRLTAGLPNTVHRSRATLMA